MERGLSLSAAQAGGADTLGVQDRVCQMHNSDSGSSARSQGQENADGSSYGSAEYPQDLKDGSGTEHSNLPLLPESAEHEQGADESLLEQSESWPGDGTGEDPQDGAAPKGPGLPQGQDPAGHRQGEAASLLEQSQSCPRDGIGTESQDSQDGSAPGNKQKRTLQECLGKWIRSPPVQTLLLMIVLLIVAIVFQQISAVVSGRRQTDIPVTAVAPVTPMTPVTTDTLRLLACPKGWVRYQGICYFLSKDHRSWDQAQARCSERNASLAMIKDTDMEFLFRLSGNDNPWLGLRRRDQGLQWVDGSSFSSSVPVLGYAECVFLADDGLKSESCSNKRRYMCSRPETHPG